MRTLFAALFVPLIAFSPVELQKPAAKAGDKPAEKVAPDPSNEGVTTQMLAPLESIAKQLAKGGREKEMKDLLKALEKLGYPKANFDKLEKACKDDLAKARTAIDSLPSGAKQLRVTAKQLAVLMEKMEGEPKLELARKILLLDGELESAHTVLGHVKVGKHWVPEEQVELRKERGEIFDKVQEAKKLDVEMEVGEIDEPLIQQACGVKATSVRHGTLELRSNFSAEKTQRLMRETMRAWALSNWLRKGKLAVPPHPKEVLSRSVWILIDSREQYKKLAAELAKSGELTPETVQMMERPNTEVGAYGTKNGVYIQLAQWEGDVEANLLVATAGMREGVLTPFTAGHLNWVALSCLGHGLPNYFFKTEKPRFGGDTHVETEDQKREREERLRISKAGIAGSRSWMQFLAERNEDPPFSNCFVDKLGAVAGDDLHKATSIVEYLQEAKLFAPTYSLLSKNASGKLMELYKGALGMSVGELESKWRTWILGNNPGVAERIDKQNLNAYPPEALAVLEYTNQLREKAFKESKIEGLWALKFDPELSEACAAHVAYLEQNPEQQDKWPDAHEEYSDKPGYSVDGAWAGTHSVIISGNLDDYKNIVDGWVGTFYHRLPVLDPGLLRIGWGWQDKVAVMDTGSLAAPYEKPYTVCWPYDGMTNVPTAFDGNEFPDPVPDPNGPKDGVNESAVFGYPITIQSSSVDERGATVDIVMKLFEGKDGKTEVPCHFSSPSKPSNPEAAPAGAWCLIPKSALKLKTEYKVVADWVAGEKKSETSAGRHLEWTFKTN